MSACPAGRAHPDARTRARLHDRLSHARTSQAQDSVTCELLASTDRHSSSGFPPSCSLNCMSRQACEALCRVACKAA